MCKDTPYIQKFCGGCVVLMVVVIIILSVYFGVGAGATASVIMMNQSCNRVQGFIYSRSMVTIWVLNSVMVGVG